MNDVHLSVSIWVLLGAAAFVALGFVGGVVSARYAARRRRKSERAAAAAAAAAAPVGTADWLFVGSAAEYYIAGRYAVFAHLSPVSGNLLHHAIEMFLKAALNKKRSLEQLTELKHDLRNIWAAFSHEFPTTPQRPWTRVVNELHRFEELRYPGSIVKLGAGISISYGPRPRSLPLTTGSEPHDELWLGEIDELVEVILEHGSIKPDFVFAPVFRSEAREYLSRDNNQPWSQRR